MRAVGIHLGLNAVDAGHYMGWPGTLAACENDARDMAAIARSGSFETELLLTRDATSTRLLRSLAAEAARMNAGDMLMLTMAGHGTQLPDRDGTDDDDESDRFDETWVLYDRIMIDDELHGSLARFRPGVRILVVSDTCHSETVSRAAPAGLDDSPARLLPSWTAQTVISANGAVYARASSATPRLHRDDGRVDVLLMSACKDHQLALDGERNGKFTGALRAIWSDGRFRGDYISLVKSIREIMPSSQTPGLRGFGSHIRRFAAMRPFSAG